MGLGLSLATMAANAISSITAPVPNATLADEVANRLRIGAEVQLLADDNLLRLAPGRPTPPGRSKSDVRGGVFGVVDVAQRLGLQRLFVNGAAGYDRYARNHFLNRERINLYGGAEWQASPRCGGEVSLRFARGQSNLEDLGILLRNTRESRSWLADAGCTLGVGIRPQLSITRRLVDNSAPARRITDLRETRISGGLSLQRTERTRLTLALAQERFRFPGRPLPALGIDDAVRVRSATLRLSRRIGARGSAAAYLAYTDADSRNPTARDFRGVTGGGSASLAVTPRVNVSVAGGRDIRATGDIAAGYYIADRLDGAATWRLGPRLEAEIGAGSERRRFRAIDVLVAGARRYDRTVSVHAGAAYTPWRPVRIGLLVEHADRRTDATFGTYRGTRGTLTVGLSL